MKNRNIKVSRYLYELHGESPDIFTLIITYLAGIITGILALIFTYNLSLPVWKSILLFLIYADIAGGVISNFSSSTKAYYRTNKNLRIPFILMHSIHPGALILLFPVFACYFIYTGLFAIISCLILTLISKSEIKLTTALFLLLSGIVFSFYFSVPVNFLFSFAPIFMTKLIIGFSVDIRV